ncbi:MAG: GDSL family lipase, partial [Ruminococcaceae bacterium]|nr:GDSL family lipase [Oscillospiraceae bacterium]
MIKFVFQGDSITDAGRDRDNIAGYGVGYPNLVASELMFKYPGKFEFINEGISGDRIVDLYARIKQDLINHKPDYL